MVEESKSSASSLANHKKVRLMALLVAIAINAIFVYVFFR